MSVATPELSPAKRALLERWRRGRVEGLPAGTETISRWTGSGPPPLSFAQERIWALDQVTPDGAIHNLTGVARLRGIDLIGPGRLRGIDPRQMLERAVNEVVRRHDVLRASFRSVDGRPVQQIASELQLPIDYTDLRSLPEAVRQAEAERLAREVARRPFDLARGPLIRVHGLRVVDDELLVVISMHHIVTDSWSFRVLVGELGAFAAMTRGQAPILPPLPIQYGDFAAWQRDRMQGNAMVDAIGYWRQHLAGAPAALELPTDRTRPPVMTYAGSSHPFIVEASLTESLRALSRREGVSLFATMLAAFAVLLSRYSGQREFVLGVPVLGRDRPEVSGLIGCFINTLGLRCDLTGEPTFAQLLRRLRDVLLGGLAHQEVPFAQVVSALQPERDVSRTPVFQCQFNLRRDESELLPHARSDDFGKVPSGSSQGFDLYLDAVERRDTIAATVEYNTALFEAATVERMAGHYRRLLKSIVREPEAGLSELELLGLEERTQLLEEWNQTGAEIPGGCLHQLIEAQVERAPEAVATLFGEERLNYRELNRRANQLAHHLRGLGVGPDVLVGVCLERSLEMVVALLGVLKAGGAYLPLDPDSPRERLGFMLEDGRAAVLVAQERLKERLPEHGARLLLIDREWAEIEKQPGDNASSGVEAHNLAYVIYTSGSTGQPKGVTISHLAIKNRILWAVKQHGLGETDRMLQKTTIAFDAATWEFFAPLASGGTVVMAQPGAQRDPGALVRAVAEHGVTVLQLVPSMLRLVAEEPHLESCKSLRLVFSAGEALPVVLCDRLVGRIPVSLYNGYGATECAVDSTAAEYHAGSGDGVFVVGAPIANTRVFILDAHLNLVPVGVPGEVYIGGVGLARGYVNRPDLTAERFVPDPFSGPGCRLYRTGDLARWRADGNLEFRGRIDNQLKIRGFRIEPGEVEAALAQHPGLNGVIVSGREDAQGDKRLVAYFTTKGGSQPGILELHDFLGQRLPSHMIPASFVALEEFPLTTSGKIDRKALPEPDAMRSSLQGEYVAPRTPAEEVVAGIWAEVLGLDRVGIHDDFFNLGGHSLVALQMVARVREVFDVDFPLPSLFEAPTLQAVAGVIDGLCASGGDGGARLPGIPIVSREGELPLSFAQQRLWFLDHFMPGKAYYNIPVPIRLRGPLHQEALEQSVNEMLRRHEGLRARFPDLDGRPIQVIVPTLNLALDLRDAGHLPPAEQEDTVRRWAEAETLRLFDLAQGPLVRGQVIRLGPDDYLLLLVLHHIVTDGWSTEILIRELTTVYEAYRAGRPSPLPELTVQYADFAAWQRSWLQGDVLKGELAYWERRLKGAPTALELPSDRLRPAVQSLRSGHVPFSVGPSLRQRVEDLSAREGATLFMTLLAALKALLHRYTGEHDIVVGSPVAGRGRREVEGLIGFFVNTLVLRTDLDGDPSFRELIARVRAGTLEAFAHQEIPFEKLVEELQPERDLSRTPLFQVMFAFNAVRPQAQAVDGVMVDPMLVEYSPTRCDLTLYLIDTGTELRGSFEYGADLFEQGTIERLAGHFANLLESAVKEPGRRVSAISLMTAAEEQQQLTDWNATVFPDSPDETFQDLFEAQVRRTPDAVAAADREGAVSYAELNRRANRLAWSLAAAGVGPETRVGVVAERSLGLLASMLAVFKAGGACVPLEPTYPARRLRQVVQQSACRVLLTTRALLPGAGELVGEPGGGDRPVLIVVEKVLASDQPEDDPPGRSDGRNLAYVIFTSGSTGVPKGAMVEHAGMLNHLRAKVADLDLTSADRVAQTAPVSFDISVWQFLAVLIVGGRVHVFPDDEVQDAARLLAALDRDSVSVLELVPSVLEVLLEEATGASEGTPALASLRWLIATGEALSPALCRRLMARFPWVRIMNAYGPTECSDDVSHHVVPGPPVETLPRVPIGRPVRNTRLYVVDSRASRFALRPIGAPGELCVAGTGVGRGYLNEPDRTADAFVPDPFSPVPGGRLYRTGDLARYRADGQAEYLGRIDQQVKIRGNRVELGEIEAVLRLQPGLRDAAVLAREDAFGVRRMVAYLLPDAGELPDDDTLRRALRERLPEYMVPSAFVRLATWPLTASGKLDRQALPPPEPLQAQADEAPRTPVEEILAAIWAELLGVESVGVHANFFALGGHSLLAMQLVSRIRGIFGIELLVRAVFEAQTVAELAGYLAAHEPEPGSLDRVAGILGRVQAMTPAEVEAGLGARGPGG